MSMPGFNAEGSVYKSSRYYIGRPTSGALGASVGITPQLPIGFCMAECDDQYQWGTLDNQVCKFGCMDAGSGGGGGGGGGGGDLSDCALCRKGCQNKFGAQKTKCLNRCKTLFCS